VLGFAEHVDFDPNDPGYGFFDYEAIQRAVTEAKGRYAPDLEVLLGVEVDYQTWFEDSIRTFLSSHRFEYVIGSVHAVDGLQIMGREYMATRTPTEAYRDYYEAVAQSARSGLFDIIGHVGYALRRGLKAIGPPDAEALRACTDAALDAIAQSGACLELNSAGYRHGVGTCYPPRYLVDRYHALGGRHVTLGSDAHRPVDVGGDLAGMLALCRNQPVTFLDRRLLRMTDPKLRSTALQMPEDACPP
jgi:histidinol-phosphatase (PHP family)